MYRLEAAKKLATFIVVSACSLLLAAPAFASEKNPIQGQGQAVVTVLAKHGNEPAAAIVANDLKLSVDGKPTSVTNWVPLGPQDSLELVLLIDNSARTTLGKQIEDIAHFVQNLPPNTKSAIAYMEYGRAVLATPLSADHAKVLSGLHIPSGFAGSSASPYFCLSELAKHWPSDDRHARREVVMVTDGVDEYNPRYDPGDPYVQGAIGDSVRAGLVVYSIYWHSRGPFSSGIGGGQNLLAEVSQATGGTSYWMGTGNPVSFLPFFKDLNRRMESQYRLSFDALLKGRPEVVNLKLKIEHPQTKFDAPQQVFVSPVTTAPASTPAGAALD